MPEKKRNDSEDPRPDPEQQPNHYLPTDPGKTQSHHPENPADRELALDVPGDQDSERHPIIGPYKLLQIIGVGGMGEVWIADQLQPVKRRVALKLIKSGLGSKEIIARFEAERQALALMNHPNIARILDAGTTEQGQPYFVMELVTGVPLTTFSDQNRLSIDERLKLFTDVCSGVQHAHQKGIIHRDLKPGNIIVGMEDGVPVPKIIDFGLAKAMENTQRLTDLSLFTGIGQILGTLKYMSPEQASLDMIDIDTQTDIYALGVILYELLTGSTPLDDSSIRGQAALKVLEFIREMEPVKPSSRLGSSTDAEVSAITGQRKTDSARLTRILAGDLDWIVMKALEKDRTRRYESASGFAADIQRYLSSEPVIARPPSLNYRVRKFVRKNRAMVMAGVAVAGSLLLGIVAFAWQAQVARGQRNRAVNAESETKARADELQKVSDFQAQMLQQIDPTQAGVQLMTDILSKFDAALDAAKPAVPFDERARRVAMLKAELMMVNATDTARGMIDRTVLKPSIEAIDKEFPDQPLVNAQLRQTMANLYRELGLYQASVPLQNEAFAIRRRIRGDEHPDTLISKNNLGLLLQSEGKLHEAEPIFREALETCRHVLGDEHPDTLISIANMGGLLQAQGKLKEAEPYYREALEKYRRLLGEDHPDTLKSLSNMGNLLRDQDKLDEAEPYLRNALEKFRRVKGEEHPDTLVLVNNIGFLLRDQGRLAEAEPYLREAMEKFRRVQGEEHPNTMTAINNIGLVLQAQSKLAEAEPFFREGLEKKRRVLGDDHAETLLAIVNIGNLLRDQGKLAEAEPYLREGLEKFRHFSGDEHSNTLASLISLGALLNSQGKLDDAEPLLREAMETSRRVLGEEHQFTLISINNLAAVLRAQNKLAEAEPYFRELLEKRRRVFDKEHPQTLASISGLGILLQAQGKLTEAEPLFLELLEKRRHVFGEEHPDTLKSGNSLGNLLQSLGKLNEAEQLFRDTLDKHRRVSGNDHPDTMTVMAGLGFVLQAQDKLTEAEPYFREALDSRLRVLGENNPDTLSSLANLGSLLQAQGKLEEADKYLRQALEKFQELAGKDHPYTLISTVNMGGLRVAQKRFAEAATLLAPIETNMRKAFAGAYSYRVGQYLTILGKAHTGLATQPADFAVAESNLLEANTFCGENSGPNPRIASECFQALVDLYSAWEKTEPGKGHDTRSAEWKSKLPQVEKTPDD